MTTISLETNCSPDCNLFAHRLLTQLGSGAYDVCSVLPMPESIEDWRAENRTARKRANRAHNLGYTFVSNVPRHEYAEDIFAINTSLDERQGRPMSEGYLQRPSEAPDPIWSCERHAVHPYGIIDTEGHLRAYLWIYRAGQLALVSSILGHGDHLRSDVMYLLWQGMLENEIRHGGYVVYNRHDSGTEGLRYYKERVGLRGEQVTWSA